MKNLEGNKIAAAILVAGLIAMVTGKVADSLYKPEHGVEQKRGYSVEVVATSQDTKSSSPTEAEKPIDIVALMKAADKTKGQANFKKYCSTCHNVDPSSANKVGPGLYSIVGAPKAHHADFNYSDGLKAKGGNWEYADLFAFFKKPSAYIKGTRMSFAGLKKPEEIADIIAYLREQSASPVPLPSSN